MATRSATRTSRRPIAGSRTGSRWRWDLDATYFSNGSDAPGSADDLDGWLGPWYRPYDQTLLGTDPRPSPSDDAGQEEHRVVDHMHPDQGPGLDGEDAARCPRASPWPPGRPSAGCPGGRLSGESRAAEPWPSKRYRRPAEPNWPKSLLKLALRLVGLALLVHVFVENRDSFREVFAHRPDFRFLAMAFALCLLALVSTFLRWMIIVRAQGLVLRLRDAVRVGFAGNAVDQIVPGQVGGDVLKANYLRRSGGGTARAVASILLDRAIGILGLFTLAAAMGAVDWAHAALRSVV
ncbi:MAG: lysylphosphatidylglycerol synthase domain-containing protein [Singulisphaera sp.]